MQSYGGYVRSFKTLLFGIHNSLIALCCWGEGVGCVCVSVCVCVCVCVCVGAGGNVGGRECWVTYKLRRLITKY